VRNLANFVLFQIGWFACVCGAAEGSLWSGPLVVLLVIAVHLKFVARPANRCRELQYILAVGLFGLLADTGLSILGATRYPSSASTWATVIAPPWITALWLLFATLPHHSLRWLAGRPWLAILFGAIGGPLSYLAGSRLGAVGIGEPPLLTWGALAVEYGIAMPLLLRSVGTRQ
jgi:hypothetical protein